MCLSISKINLKIMKIQNLLYLFCVFNILNACQDNVIENENFFNYHNQINNAEKLISQEKYNKALKIYDQTFSEYHFVFLRDYIIASQLALHLDKKDKALNYIKKSIIGGWELNELKKNKILINYLSNSDWKNLENEYAHLNSEYLKRINSKIRTKVESMFDKDQEIAFKASQIEDEIEQEKFILDEFPSHSEEQIKNLIKILDKDGYPGELLTGNNFWMSTILSHHNSIAEDYVRKDTLYNFIKPKLYKALAKGQMSPYEFAMIEDWKKAVVSDSKEVSYGFINSPNESNLSEINENRGKIGLRSVELRNNLIDIELKTNMSFYLPDWIEGKIIIEKK